MASDYGEDSRIKAMVWFLLVPVAIAFAVVIALFIAKDVFGAL